MNIGKEILNIRKEYALTQEDFGSQFHVTRQTVSNWENGKSYPDLQTLVEISEKYSISLDTLLKEDKKMIATFDKERQLGTLKKQVTVIDSLAGVGTGILLSSIYSPRSVRQTIIVAVAIGMLVVSWYMKSRYDKKVMNYLQEHQ